MRPDGRFLLLSHALSRAAGRSAQSLATDGRLCRRPETARSGLSAIVGHLGRSHRPVVWRTFQGIHPRINHAFPFLVEFKSNTVTEAIYDAGFNSNGRFYANSSQTLGMTPTIFRSGGTGTTIRFAVGECSLGSVLVASSEKGVCAISLGDDPDALVRDLQDQFPKARLIGGDKKFERMVAQVIGFIEAPKTGLDLPLDVRGTAFQQKVWRTLREIPAGSTVSYTEIAERIGAPKAVRAVAQACASNHIAVAIPCHRVLRHDGDLSGYRWGVQRKSALLAREAAAE
jgi:AraC family transcriptional regulator, regulatory protein of adaptative response / methylated-DNA-[protein]-cysteine methyltransferase